MGKKHDENKDLRMISRVAKIDYAIKHIRIPKEAIIGIKTWGRIDYLVNYCGWTCSYDNSIVVRNSVNTDTTENTKKKKEVRKATKAPKTTNKKKK